ncbi:MAG: hypothetical protein IT380_22535 [Myxococcales bacterium]|nr:hypothetical protein [Myxococcales bacterium]
MLPALLLALTLAAPRCTPEGVYKAEAGFFTTFDGKGRWATSGADLSPIIQGPVYREGNRMRFKLDGAGETAFPWFASFSADCSSFVLKYEKGGGQPDIHFRRQKSVSDSSGLRQDRSPPPAAR